MPPINFVEAQALSEISASMCGGQVPTHAKTGDVLLAVFGCFDARDWDQTVAAEDVTLSSIVYHVDPTAWSLVSRQVQVSDVVMVMRHVVTSSEPAFWAIPLTLASTKKLQGALMIYRDIDASAPVVEASASSVAATVNFTLPSRTLVNYSDLYIGVAYERSSNTVLTPNAVLSLRYHAEDGGGQSSIMIADQVRNVPGATGTRSCTSPTAQSGIAASFAIRAIPAKQPDSIDPVSLPAGIGFFGRTLANPT